MKLCNTTLAPYAIRSIVCSRRQWVEPEESAISRPARCCNNVGRSRLCIWIDDGGASRGKIRDKGNGSNVVANLAASFYQTAQLIRKLPFRQLTSDRRELQLYYEHSSGRTTINTIVAYF